MHFLLYQGEAGLSGLPGREGAEVNSAIRDQNWENIHYYLCSLFTHNVSSILCAGKTGLQRREGLSFRSMSMITFYFVGNNSSLFNTYNFYTGWEGWVWHSRNQRRQGMKAPKTLHILCFQLDNSYLLYELCLILWSFSFLCDVFQGPEGSVGTRGLRGLQVCNILISK